jgi:hypothetical protein
VNQQHSHPVSELLVRWKTGDQEALAALVPLVDPELRNIAHHHLQRERPGHTLQSAALVHEAYLRLADGRPFDSDSRAHFLAVASRLMRSVKSDWNVAKAWLTREMKRGKSGENRAVAKN